MKNLSFEQNKTNTIVTDRLCKYYSNLNSCRNIEIKPKLKKYKDLYYTYLSSYGKAPNQLQIDVVKDVINNLHKNKISFDITIITSDGNILFDYIKYIRKLSIKEN